MVAAINLGNYIEQAQKNGVQVPLHESNQSQGGQGTSLAAHNRNLTNPLHDDPPQGESKNMAYKTPIASTNTSHHGWRTSRETY